MEKWADFIKSLVRPVIIIYGVCIVSGIEVPCLLSGLISAVTIEYFGERALRG